MRLGIAAILLLTTPAFADVISTFDVSDEGWIGISADLPSYTIGPAFPVTHSGGGYIAFADPNSSEAFFRAPSGYLGNRLQFRGGSLSWMSSTTHSPNYAGPLLVLKGNGLTLVYETGNQPIGLNSFTSISATLAPGANWRLSTGALVTTAQFHAVLQSLNEVWITAEPHYGVEETTSLDNVILHAVLPASAVPEPVELSLFAIAGLIACAVKRLHPLK